MVQEAKPGRRCYKAPALGDRGSGVRVEGMPFKKQTNKKNV